MKSDSYILIQGWMVNELSLKSHSLLVFAIIYGYSKDNQGKFEGSLNYLCKSTGASKNTIMNCLNELIENGLILKETILINNITFCKYSQNDMVVQNLVWGGAIFAPGGGAIFAPNNTNNNNTKENKQILFSESIYNDYEFLRNHLSKDDKFKSDYSGVDLKFYIEDCLAWSVSKNNKSTDKGWLLTLRQWIKRAKLKNELRLNPDFIKKQEQGHINY